MSSHRLVGRGSILHDQHDSVPSCAAVKLEGNGIDLDAIIRASEDPNTHGTFVEVEQHGKNERIVVIE